MSVQWVHLFLSCAALISTSLAYCVISVTSFFIRFNSRTLFTSCYKLGWSGIPQKYNFHLGLQVHYEVIGVNNFALRINIIYMYVNSFLWTGVTMKLIFLRFIVNFLIFTMFTKDTLDWVSNFEPGHRYYLSVTQKHDANTNNYPCNWTTRLLNLSLL